MKKIHLLVALSCLVSCDMTENQGGIFTKYTPCHVESIAAFIGGESIKNDTTEVNNSIINTNLETFCISVFTFDSIAKWNGDIDEFHTNFASAGAYCKESIYEVEKYIQEWVEKQINSVKLPKNTPWGDKIYENCYCYSYRLEGITSFSITANKPFNNIEAGKEISQYFVIEDINPNLIFSYSDYSTYTIRSSIDISIFDWLAMRPLASPYMLLKLKDCTSGAISDIIFTITMTLTDGRVLSATTCTVSLV